MTLALTQALEPTHVYVVSLLAGLVRPSDLVMRNGLIGDTISDSKLMSAMGLSRTTMDTARIIGALFGAGLFSLFGLGVGLERVPEHPSDVQNGSDAKRTKKQHQT